jgi:carboxymethylenebutenolidase
VRGYLPPVLRRTGAPVGEMAEFPVAGRSGSGYLSPAHEGAGLGVVVIHEEAAVDDHVRDVCDRLAAEGCTALAPALLDGSSTGDVGSDRVAEELTGAVDFLLDHHAVRGQTVGVVGFGVGGDLALWLATLRPDGVAAVVPFYGVDPWTAEARPDFSRLEAAVEGHYSADDGQAGSSSAEELQDTLTELGKDVRTFVYPGTHPAFFNDSRPDVYDEEAARVAWVRTLELLRSKLG